MGFALILIAIFVVAAAGFWPSAIPKIYARVGCAGLALMFSARAIGDIRYVGFFKQVRGSAFASRDTWFYSPLCLVLAILIAIVAIGHPTAT